MQFLLSLRTSFNLDFMTDSMILKLKSLSIKWEYYLTATETMISQKKHQLKNKEFYDKELNPIGKRRKTRVYKEVRLPGDDLDKCNYLLQYYLECAIVCSLNQQT